MKYLLALILSITLVAYAADVIAGKNWKGKIYWAIWGEDKIVQANYYGSNKRLFVKTNKFPVTLFVDAKDGIMYWTTWGQGLCATMNATPKASIQQCQMDDCPNTIKTIVEQGKTAAPVQLALDRVNGFIYWSDRNRDLVQRCKLDGSGIETVLILKGQDKVGVQPIGTEIDEENGILYWSEKHTNRIGRIKLTNLKLPYKPKESDYIVTEDLDGPNYIRVDKSRHKIFISEIYSNQISWVSIDGGIPSEIVNTRSNKAVGIALDRKEGKIFFVRTGNSEISSVKMDGTGLKKICDYAGVEPMGIFFVPNKE